MSRPLTVAIDARELAGQPTGVGTYVAGVLREWAAAPFPHRLRLVAHAPLPAALTSLPLTMDVTLAPAAVAGTWWEQVTLPGVLAGLHADVLLAPAYTAPLRTPLPTVLIVHDVSFCAQPAGFRWREGLRRRWLTRFSARKAAVVLTDSAFSQREIVRHLGVGADRVQVAPQGGPLVSADDGAARGPQVLYVGTLFTRRHIPELLAAFARVAARIPDARLTLVGQNHTHPRVDPMALAATLGLADRVAWHPYVSSEALDQLYRSARAFVFLSDYEGFGMTPLEAAARGVPSVVLDTDVAREIYADGVVRVPLDPAAVADALLTLLTDAGAHAATLTRARARLDAFPWSRTAAVVRAALERAAR